MLRLLETSLDRPHRLGFRRGGVCGQGLRLLLPDTGRGDRGHGHLIALKSTRLEFKMQCPDPNRE